MTAKKSSLKLLCRKCRINTNHNVLYTDQQSSDDEEDGPWWEEKNHLVKCMGCDHVALYRHYINSESLPDTTDQVFPDPAQGREPIDDYFSLPKQLRKIYLETLKALDSEQPILTGIGVRVIIETVCKERNASGRNLAKKVDNLVAQGVLTPDGAKLLHKLRTMGNQAAHEVKPHSSHELSLAMDVVNHLLLGVYILPKHADETFE